MYLWKVQSFNRQCKEKDGMWYPTTWSHWKRYHWLKSASIKHMQEHDTLSVLSRRDGGDSDHSVEKEKACWMMKLLAIVHNPTSHAIHTSPIASHLPSLAHLVLSKLEAWSPASCHHDHLYSSISSSPRSGIEGRSIASCHWFLMNAALHILNLCPKVSKSQGV